MYIILLIMGKTMKYEKAIAELQAISKSFIQQFQDRGKEFYGDVRLHVKEIHYDGRTMGEHMINRRNYERVIVYRVSLSQSKAFGIGKKKVCELEIVLAYTLADDISIRTIAGKVAAFIPIQPKGSENILGGLHPTHTPKAHPLLEVIDRVRKKISAAFEVSVYKEEQSY